MKKSSGERRQHANHGSNPRIAGMSGHFLTDPRCSSPRAALAFSALAVAEWIRAQLNGLTGLITVPHRAGYQRSRVESVLLVVLLSSLMGAQQTSPTTTATLVVPRLVNYSGHISSAPSKTAAGIAGMTFSIYREQDGGAPLWMETQNVNVDTKGNYTAQLGAGKSEGLPLELFNTSEPRWLGVRINSGEEQPRVLLLSVPYALKAADAETIGGLPPSAFVLAAPPNAGAVSPASAVNPAAVAPATKSNVTTNGGTVNLLPLWTTATNIQNSALAQTGSGATAKIGIGTTTPASTLDVKGTVRGSFTLPPLGAATASSGKNSQPLDFLASAFNKGTSAPVQQSFILQAEPAGNNTASPSATLNLLHAAGTATPTETGLKISAKGLLTFAPGQTFPGGGGGSVTSVGLSAPSLDFAVSGSPVTGSGTLGLSWKISPTNTNTASAIVKRDGTGSFSAGTINAIAINANNSASGGVAIVANSSSSVGILGGSGTNAGVWGDSTSGTGTYGDSASGRGVWGQSTSNQGVEGDTSSASAYGVFGYNSAVNGIGIYGSTSGSTGTGVLGYGNTGVKGISASIDGSGAGVYAQGRVGSAGIYAVSDDLAWAVNAYNVGTGTGVLAGSALGDAGFFNGNVEVDGNLSKQGGSFKIDHPLDPANKYLYHSFVESPDMMNIYNGNVTTNAAAEAVVTLPEWFETLNRDFRYQLTVIGQFAQAIVAGKVANHQFSIKTDKPNVEVSWQVAGIRQDAWANAHRIPVEAQKPAEERGSYLHPELYGAPEEKGVLWARSPKTVKQWKESRTRAAQKINDSPPAP